MTVSVVVPLHDGATTVEETLRSVVAQTYEDWELLVVDDASADEGPALVQSFERARLLPAASSVPQGPSAARNRGLAEAAGTFVVFLDADDVWDPTFLERRVATMSGDPELGLAWGPARYWYPDEPDADFVQPTGVVGVRRFDPVGPALGWLQDLRSTPCTMATLFRTAALVAVGGYPPELRRGEDIAACLLVAADHPTHHDPAVLARYRRHAASATRTAERSGTRADDDLAFARWALSWARSRPELGLAPIAARALHAEAHRQVAGLGPVAARRELSRLVLAEPGARARWWAVGVDWVLPLALARRVTGRLERRVRYQGD